MSSRQGTSFITSEKVAKGVKISTDVCRLVWEGYKLNELIWPERFHSVKENTGMSADNQKSERAGGNTELLQSGRLKTQTYIPKHNCLDVTNL